MRSAEARLSASTMISSSIRFSLVGAQVDWTTNTSRARTFWLISTVTSPSEKRPTRAAPSEVPRWLAISAANPGLALPVKTRKSGWCACMRVPGVVAKGEAYLLREEIWQGRKDSNLCMPESKSGALTSLATPLHGGRPASRETDRPPMNVALDGPAHPGDEPPDCRICALAMPLGHLQATRRAAFERTPHFLNRSSWP